ncbi:hypothetical protein AB4Y44_10010 [Paraburkholderia sp. BR10937]|uniref:hypothetical protein n=1 Tax=Paraburkholderia sp. BR10937 TaxID=3236994 RepID=UPI0034D29B2A
MIREKLLFHQHAGTAMACRFILALRILSSIRSAQIEFLRSRRQEQGRVIGLRNFVPFAAPQMAPHTNIGNKITSRYLQKISPSTGD